MRDRLIIFFILLISFLQCRSPRVKITNQVDPDIILINIEEGDRVFIANLLLKIDSLKPKVLGIEAYFEKEKDTAGDSILANAFRKINNDILIYSVDGYDNPFHSLPKFTSLVSDEGFIEFETGYGSIMRMTPIPVINERTHQSFALKITKRWNNNFKSPVKENETTVIVYSRTIDQFIHFDGSMLLETNMSNFDLPALSNKIILLGYIGPGKKDKYFTPLRYVEGKEYKDGEPDTYGLIIVANEIRTLLDYNK